MISTTVPLSPAGLRRSGVIVVAMAFTAAWTAAIDEWLVSLRAAGRPATTIRTRRQQVQQLATALELVAPWDVTEDDLLGYLGTQHWAAETRHAHRSAIRSFYGWALHKRYVTGDPSRELPSVRRTPPRARPLPEDAAAVALATADERTALMIRLAGEHGLRRSEIAQVHSRDVFHDLLGYSLQVHGKGDRVRFVPLADEVAFAILDARGFAFPGAIDGHLSPWWVGKLVQRVLPAGWTTHTLRHRFATRLYADQRDVFVTQAALGHASPATTLRYVALPDDAVRAGMSTVRIGKPDTRPQTSRSVVSHLRGTA